MAALLFRPTSMGWGQVSPSAVYHWPFLYMHGSALTVILPSFPLTLPLSFQDGGISIGIKFSKFCLSPVQFMRVQSDQTRKYSTDLSWVTAFLFLASAEMFDWIH